MNYPLYFAFLYEIEYIFSQGMRQYYILQIPNQF